MKLFKILFSASLTFLPMESAQAIDRLAESFPGLPKDAREVAERIVACNYFSGELNGDGGDRDLNAMRAKYRKNPRVLAALKEADQ